MKKLIYIFSALLLTLFSCSEDRLMEEPSIGIGDYVTLNFTVDNLPDFQTLTKVGGESAVGSMSLMTFDENGNFLGRVDATELTASNNASGTGKAAVHKNTRIIHFLANMIWSGDEYKIPIAGQTEQSLMPALSSDAPFVAWGRVAGITSLNGITVSLLRNYAKLTVESNAQNFNVQGFVLYHYVNKGTIVTYNEDGNSGFENITNVSNALTKITPISPLSFASQTESSLNMSAKYMFEYSNNYDSQTSVIIKKNGANQYYKIQLIDSDGKPYIIERNYIYKVIIKSFTDEAKGYATFEDAQSGAANNNIYAEVIKEAETVQSGNNKLTVSPLFHMFTQSGMLNFSANYWIGSTLTNSTIKISSIDNKSFLSGLTTTVGANGAASANITVSNVQQLDSTVLLVEAGVLKRYVTVYINKGYIFNPVGSSYTTVGDPVTLQFTIPNDYPASLYPVKCYIKAEDLNPKGTESLLIEYKDGTYYYIYNATSPGTKTLSFKTTRASVTNPTISSDYFTTGTFVMTKNSPGQFANISGTAYYEKGSTFDLSFTLDKPASSVTISGSGVATVTTGPLNAGQNTVTLTTTSHNASGNIMLSAYGFDDGSGNYTNNGTLKANYTITGSLKYDNNTFGSTSNASINADFAIKSYGDISTSNYVTSGGYIVSCSITGSGKYEMILKANTVVTSPNNAVKFSLTDSNKNNVRYSQSTTSLANFFTNPDMTCRWSY